MSRGSAGTYHRPCTSHRLRQPRYMNGGGAGPLGADRNRGVEPPAGRGPSTMSPTARGSRMGEGRRCKEGGAAQVPQESRANSHGFDIIESPTHPAALFRVQPGPSDEVTNRNMIASPHGANAWRRCSERESIQRSNGALTALLNSKDTPRAARETYPRRRFIKLCWSVWPSTLIDLALVALHSHRLRCAA